MSENSPIKENGSAKKPSKNASDDNVNTETNSFTDIKKKLRLVLGNTSEIPYYIKVRVCFSTKMCKFFLNLNLMVSLCTIFRKFIWFAIKKLNHFRF